MEKEVLVQNAFIFVPIKAGAETVTVEMLLMKSSLEEKVYEFEIPVYKEAIKEYPADYFAPIPVKRFMGEKLLIKGDFTESFINSLQYKDTAFIKDCSGFENRPDIHFTPTSGWMNDPNGLVFDKGCFHMYFQYNPYDVKWNNMCWGHAVSKDLLHWEQLETTIYPDENGMMFSGSGIINERGLLGLPKDALLFFYSAAGNFNQWSKDKTFTQRIAYSIDGGKILHKLEKPVVDTICRENRDPKVFWHEDSNAYIMVIWLEENDFAILRSTDLRRWELSDRITLDGAWECPDLFMVKDEEGKDHWVFIAAGGIYFWGDFDGYRFAKTGESHTAYFTDTLYAAQTYSGVSDRKILVPWLRLDNRGELYTGAMGIPRELDAVHKKGQLYLRQKPVKEFLDLPTKEGYYEFQAKELVKGVIVAGIKLSYNKTTKDLFVGEKKYEVIQDAEKIVVLVDGDIMEIFVDDGIMTGAFWTAKR